MRELGSGSVLQGPAAHRSEVSQALLPAGTLEFTRGPAIAIGVEQVVEDGWTNSTRFHTASRLQ